jgi:hypothetical protein
VLDRLVKIISEDERLIALVLIAIGSAIALTHLSTRMRSELRLRVPG